jgi:hypothetical protein
MSGVAFQPPVIAPIPAEYDNPITARKRPMPTPVAVLRLAGINFTSHCRRPVKARNRKTRPSMKMAVKATEYETFPDPL